MSEERESWLANLIAGDEVAVVLSLHGDREVVELKKVRSRQDGFIYAGPYKFLESNGHVASARGWRIEPVTEERRAAAKHNEISVRLSEEMWQNYPLHVLVQVAAVLDGCTELTKT